MDLIKLLDIASPKNTKNTINLLITNYNDLEQNINTSITEISEDVKTALNNSTTAVQIATDAKSVATTSKTIADEAKNIAMQASENVSGKLSQDDIVQTTGTATDKVMSQAAVTNVLNNLSTDSVQYTAQILTDTQQKQARENISAQVGKVETIISGASLGLEQDLPIVFSEETKIANTNYQGGNTEAIGYINKDIKLDASDLGLIIEYNEKDGITELQRTQTISDGINYSETAYIDQKINGLYNRYNLVKINISINTNSTQVITNDDPASDRPYTITTTDVSIESDSFIPPYKCQKVYLIIPEEANIIVEKYGLSTIYIYDSNGDKIPDKAVFYFKNKPILPENTLISFINAYAEFGNTTDSGSSSTNLATLQINPSYPIVKQITILQTDWISLENSSPYDYFATVNLTSIYDNYELYYCELINNSPIIFANHGFVINNINEIFNEETYTNTITLTIYSIGKPTENQIFEIHYKTGYDPFGGIDYGNN